MSSISVIGISAKFHISATLDIGHYEVISTNEGLIRRRAKHHRILLSNFTKQWLRQYLLSLCEAHSIRRSTGSERLVNIGDVVVVYDEFTKRVFWRLGIVTELLTGQDGLIRAAVVKTVNCDKISYLQRSITHLIPIELSVNIEADKETTTTPQLDQDTTSTRPQRRVAAIRGELQCRQS